MIDASDSETGKGLEKGNIIAESVDFLAAGYETTSTALTFATYLLAANPEAQERLANEIHEYLEENPVSDIHCFSMPTMSDKSSPGSDGGGGVLMEAVFTDYMHPN